MSFLQRRAAKLLVACSIVLLSLALAQAQEQPLRAVGSGLAAPIVQSFVEATGTPLELTVAGSSAGLEALCQRGAEIALSARPLSAAEEAACTLNGVSFSEFLIGHNILTLAVNAADDVPQCLTLDQVNQLLAPSAAMIDWTGFVSAIPALPLTVLLPPEDTAAFAIADQLVSGVGLRAVNATTQADRAAMLANVASTPGALAITTGAALPDGLRAIAIDSGISGCATATAESVERRVYTPASRLFLYVNSDQLAAAQPLLEAMFAEGALAASTAPEFTAPSETALGENRTIAAEGRAGRSFSREVTAYSIPQNLVGEISIAGSADAKPYIESLNSAFVGGSPSVTLLYTPLGVQDGVQRFCNGEIDMVSVFAPLTEDQTAACAQNDVIAEPFFFGAFAPVVVVGNGTAFAECLTTAEVAAVWGASVGSLATTWSTVREAFPAEQALTVFRPATSGLLSDILVAAAPNTAPRADGETNDDPAYRAAAVANVVGGVTYMAWSDYLSLPANEAERVRALAIDGGSGCVPPTQASIADGTYPLARPLTLLVRRSSLARQDVQAYLWFALSDANYTLISAAGLDGIEFDELASRRSALEALFPVVAQEVADAMQQAAEATPEPEAAGEPEATGEPEAEATAEATPDAEATPESSGG